jgi:hypothetical protein
MRLTPSCIRSRSRFVGQPGRPCAETRALRQRRGWRRGRRRGSRRAVHLFGGRLRAAVEEGRSGRSARPLVRPRRAARERRGDDVDEVDAFWGRRGRGRSGGGGFAAWSDPLQDLCVRLVIWGAFAALLVRTMAQGCTSSPAQCEKTSDCPSGDQCLYKMGDCKAHGECKQVPDTSSGGCSGPRECSGNGYDVCGCNGQPVGVQSCYPDGYASGPTSSNSPIGGACSGSEDAGVDAAADAPSGE